MYNISYPWNDQTSFEFASLDLSPHEVSDISRHEKASNAALVIGLAHFAICSEWHYMSGSQRVGTANAGSFTSRLAEMFNCMMYLLLRLQFKRKQFENLRSQIYAPNVCELTVLNLVCSRNV